jgi:hypothetical protein
VKPTTLRTQCYDDLGAFYLALNPGWDYVDFQQERIAPALEAVEAGDIERLAIFMPSGHAKTEWCTKTFIPWYLGRNPQKNVILMTHTDPLAKDFGGHIRDTMTDSDVFHAVFPDLLVNSRNRASNFFRTNKGNSFYAFGMDGGVTGRRGDLLVIDDPVKTLQDALSEAVQNDLFNTYQAVLKDRMRPGFRILLPMTRWAVRDFAGRILENEGKRWKVLSLRAQDPSSKCDGCRDGLQPHECTAPFLWESFYGKERYQEAREDLYIWNAKWQQSPTAQLSQGFQESWLRFYVNKYGADGKERHTEYRNDGTDDHPATVLSEPMNYDLLRKFNTYILVDPAMGKEAAHDRTCILVMAAGPERRFFLVDAVLDRLDPGERIDHIVRLTRVWKAKQVIYEEYSLVADTYFLKLKLEAEGITDLNVISVGRKAIKGMSGGGRLKKADRIMQLVPDFRDARIWLPKRLIRTCVDGTKIDIVDYFIRQEYLPWAGEGSTAHDDVLDCLSRIRDPDFFPEFAMRDKDDDEEYGYADSAGTSWESRY